MSKIDHFPYPTPIPAKFVGVPFGVDPSLGSAVRGKVRLIRREIIFQDSRARTREAQLFAGYTVNVHKMVARYALRAGFLLLLQTSIYL